MSMHTIRVTYDPTTRRISLAQGTDNYGGATTDENSVKVSVSGIRAADYGENFIARVDFGVQVKTADHIYNHPFVLLERDTSGQTPPGQPHPYSAIVPNAVLRAAGQARCRLPIQIVLADDDHVVNSRNTILLEVTQAVEGEDDGRDIPPYDVPEWTIPETQTTYSEDVHTVNVVYDPATREIKVADENSKYGGSTIDCNSVRLCVSGIEPPEGATDFSVRADFAMPVKTAEGVFVRPFTVLEQIGSTWCCMVPQPVLMAAKEQKKLPFQLIMRHGDVMYNTRNAIILEITRAINAMESIQEAYSPYIMYRNDTWAWIEDFTYGEGAVVTYNGEMYTSLTDDNLGNQPDTHPEDWSLLTGVEEVSLGGIVGERVGSQIVFTSAEVFQAAGFTIEDSPTSLDEQDRVPIIIIDLTEGSNDGN